MKSFNERVWSITKKVPKGKVTTYAEIARKMKCKAYRAVGNALNKNPYKSVPCHRVVKSDGSVGGFARGTKNKIMMLKKEKVDIKKNSVIDFKEVFYRL
ncbi:MAG: MGMT family protein [bacterium]|nr:MGMT family protein [bacterium]